MKKSSVWSVWEQFTFHPWTLPLLLLGVCGLVFGLRGLQLGFYWDDWPYIWFRHMMGPWRFNDVFAGDRPVLAWSYNLTTALLGVKPAYWQGFAILMRWACASGLWWVMRVMWPQRGMLAAGTAILFAIYPGFTQQWIAVIYGHAFLLFAALLFSLAFMVLAFRMKRFFWPFTFIACFLAGYSIFSTEYFVGLELLRPVLLFLLVQEEFGNEAFFKKIWRVSKIWLPYLLLLAAFGIWHLFFNPFKREQIFFIENQGSSFWTNVPLLILTILGDLAEASLLSWGKVFAIDPAVLADQDLLIRYIGVGLALWIGLGVYFSRLGSSPEENGLTPSWQKWSIAGVGVLAVISAGAPFWLTANPLRMGFPWDRYTLPLSVGLSLLLAQAIVGMLRTRPQQALALGLLVALAGGYHFNLALAYEKEWADQKNFFWQLAWRAPQIAPGTALISEKPGFAFNEDDSLAAPLNWLYAPGFDGQNMPYMLVNISERLWKSPAYQKTDQSFERYYRAATFQGNTNKVLVFAYEPPGCLHIVEPMVDEQVPGYDPLVHQAAALTDLKLILPSPAAPAEPPVEVFGAEPKHKWCYYYEKAMLARQMGDWQKIVTLGREAFGQGQYPKDASEYLPFIEGFGRAGLWEDAGQYSRKAYTATYESAPALCTLWARLEKTTSYNGLRDAVLRSERSYLSCP